MSRSLGLCRLSLVHTRDVCSCVVYCIHGVYMYGSREIYSLCITACHIRRLAYATISLNMSEALSRCRLDCSSGNAVMKDPMCGNNSTLQELLITFGPPSEQGAEKYADADGQGLESLQKKKS